MKIGFIISVYNKIDDLLAHLDIFKFCPFPHELIVVYLKHDIPTEYIQQIQKYHHIAENGVSFSHGPLLSMVYGVRKAKELGLDYACYRNADDWIFNWEFTKANFDRMRDNKYKCSAYNWLGHDYYLEFAMNEFYVDVNSFEETSEWAENLFLNSTSDVLCEFKMAAWVKESIKDWEYLYPFRERETQLGVGHDIASINYLYRNIFYKEVPQKVIEDYDTNNRFFNEKWQLIGSHSNRQRLEYWKRIRNSISYKDELEKQDYFSKWLDHAENGKLWNLPNSADHIENRKFVKEPDKKINKKRRIFR